jgi:hypothetical protein
MRSCVSLALKRDAFLEEGDRPEVIGWRNLVSAGVVPAAPLQVHGLVRAATQEGPHFLQYFVSGRLHHFQFRRGGSRLIRNPIAGVTQNNELASQQRLRNQV